MRKILRFVGDPTGYIVEWDSSDRPHGWLEAQTAWPTTTVLVDADKAYVIEDVAEEANLPDPTNLETRGGDPFSPPRWLVEMRRLAKGKVAA